MTIKGTVFVFVTASLLYFTIRRLVQTVQLTSEERDEAAKYLAEAQRLSHTGSWAFDVASDKYVYASEECGRIFEFDPHEGLPTREAVSRLIHPEDWPRVNEAFEKTLRDRVDTASEFRITLPSGTVKHVHAVRHPVLNDAGEVVELVGTVLDITERKRADVELRASEERFRTLVQFSFDVYWESDAEHRLTRQEFTKGPADMPVPGSEIGKAGWEIPYLAPDEAAWRQHRATLDAHLPFRDFEIVRPAQDGGKRYVSVSGMPVFDETGRFLGYRGVGRHITDRKRAEESLRQSQAYLADAERLSHTGSWALDVASNEYVYSSEEFLRIFGSVRTWEAALQRIHPDDRERVKRNVDHVIRTRADAVDEYRLVLPDGTLRHIHVIRHPVLNEAGDVVQLVGTVRDITERKRAEEERQRHLWFLESLDRINRAMQGSSDLERMLSDVLEAVLSIFACDRAWLVYPCDPQAPTWRVAMEHTRPEFPGAFVLERDLPVDGEVARVFETARSSGGAVRFGQGADQPVPEQLAERFKIQSMIAMLVPPKLGQPYLFGLHQCADPRVWTPQEERLFQEIGRRLTDALTSVLIFRTLRESERRLEEAQRIAHVGYWDRDLVAGRITLSDEGARIFGLQPEDRVVDLTVWHERWQAVIHPEDRPRAAAAAAAALAGGPRYDVEYRVVHRSGEVRIVHSQGDVIRDESGRPCRMFGIMQDITERKRAEDALRQSEAYLAEAQRLSHTGSWAFDVASDKYVYASEECGRIFEFDAQEDLPTREAISRLIHAEDWDRVNEAYEESLRKQVDTSSEFRVTLPSGTVKHVHVVRHPVLNEAGEVVQLVGTVLDITERKRAEEERERLRQLEADLAHINRVSLLGELTASIAHEVNQPLAGVVNNVGACLRWLAGDPPNLEKAREAVSRIGRDGKRAGEIIARIRALTRRAATPQEKLDPNQTIQEVLALVRDEATRNRVSIQTQFADDLSPVAGDRVQVQQVVLNLVMNGIEAMSSVSDRARDLVITTRNLDPDQVEVTVDDAGTGIDPQMLDKIFDPFYTTKPGGMGMGLSISRSIIEAHGGRLWATAKDGPGTLFHFTLPTHREEDSHA
jgi:PAS domain S-box-containing protein